MPKLPKNRTALGVHIFAGGFTVGVKAAGFDVLAHLEDSGYGSPSARMNWPEMPIHVGGTDAWPLDSLRGRVDLVYCNPPCAVFSPMGIVTTRGEGAWRTDPRLGCWYSAFDVLPATEPAVWACESVPQVYTRGREMIDELTRRALSLNYSVVHLAEDAKWTGLPQSRKRFFLVCHRPEIDLQFDYPFDDPPTVGEVLSRVKTPGHTTSHPKIAPLIQHTPEGGRVSTTWMERNPGWDSRRNAQGKVAGRPSFQDKRLSRDSVMPAYVGDKFYHPTQHRMIGINEAKALCGYPLDFKLEGRPGGWGSLLARAVMPSVGEWLARCVDESLSRPRLRRSPGVRLIDLVKPPGRRVDLTPEYSGAGSVAVSVAPPAVVVKPIVKKSATTSIKPPAVVVKTLSGRKTALATGSTPVQVGSERTQMDIVTAMRGYVAALESMGYDVDWRPVTPGEDLSRYDAVIAAVQKPNSIASRHFYGALWALSTRPDAVAVIDDWQADSILAGAQTYAVSPTRAFRLRGDDEFVDHRDEVFAQLEKFAEGDWPWPIIVPTLGAGDVSLLKVPADRVVPIDPTSFSRRYRHRTTRVSKTRRWVYASLMTRPAPLTTWPVVQFGCPDKGKGGVGPSGPDAKPRLVESALASEYLQSWGVLSPEHPHAGSGWWRVRYLMSVDAGCVLSACPAEAACLGDPYVEASDREAVEAMSDDELRDLASRQRERLSEVAWSRERVVETLASLFR